MKMNAAIERARQAVYRSAFVVGGMVLGMLGLITITGIVMSFFYTPFPGQAYESVASMMGVRWVAYIRNVHYWSSDILVGLLILHLTRILCRKVKGIKMRTAYWTGMAMTFLVFTELLLGTFLRADQEAYEAFAHFWVSVQDTVPFLAPFLMFFGEGDSALLRFFIGHIVLVPALLLVLIGAHGIYARSFRGLAKQTVEAVKTRTASIRRTKKSQLKVLGISMLVLLGMTGILAAFIPAPLFSPPFGGLEVTKPPWYLLWIYGLENIFGMKAIVYAPLTIGIVLSVLPFVSGRGKKIDTALLTFLAVVAAVTGLSIYAAVGGEVAHLGM